MSFTTRTAGRIYRLPGGLLPVGDAGDGDGSLAPEDPFELIEVSSEFNVAEFLAATKEMIEKLDEWYNYLHADWSYRTVSIMVIASRGSTRRHTYGLILLDTWHRDGRSGWGFVDFRGGALCQDPKPLPESRVLAKVKAQLRSDFEAMKAGEVENILMTVTTENDQIEAFDLSPT